MVPDDITPEQLKKIFVQGDMAYLQKIADELNTDLAKYKLDTPLRKAHFFGQIRQESGPAAKGVEESFSYSCAALKDIFGYYARNPKEADIDGYVIHTFPNGRKVVSRQANAMVIANKVYGPKGNAEALGNDLDTMGDGWKYRGRGLKQVTGKENYKKFRENYAQYFGATRDVLEQPDLLTQMPDAVRSAVWFWLRNACCELADKGLDNACIDAVTKVVNSREIRKYERDNYNNAPNNPVLKRREFTKLAYHAFI